MLLVPHLFLATSFAAMTYTGTATATATATETTATATHAADETVGARIFGGVNAVKGRYPYSVSVQTLFNLEHRCGGSLIAPDVVLSAAACVNADPDQLVIRIDPHTLANPSEDAEAFAVTERITYPQFTFQKFWDDAAIDLVLLKLDGRSSKNPVRLNSDPTIPFNGQATTTMGWGEMDNTLQVFDSAIFADTAQCNQIQQDAAGDPNIYLFENDNIMCTMELNGGGPCFRDQGGPLLVPGATADDDLQVGIYSWIIDCQNPGTPTFYTEISHTYEFIRRNVCHLSDQPPSYFECSSLEETMQPTSMPTTASQEQVTIRLEIFTDPYATETGWRLETMDGRFVEEKLPYTYLFPNAVEFETITVTLGEFYVLVLTDTFGDGIGTGEETAVQVFLGDLLIGISTFNPDNRFEQPVEIWASPEAALPTNTTIIMPPPPEIFPTVSPTTSIAPTGSNLINVTVFIKFDLKPIETSWTMTRNRDGRAIGKGGPYSPATGQSFSEVILLEEGESYTFTISEELSFYDPNRVFDGICCEHGKGFAYVYYGNEIPEIANQNALAYDDGRFDVSSNNSFVASADAIAFFTRPVTIVIWFDSKPEDVGFRLIDQTGRVVDAVPFGSFGSELASTKLAITFDLEDDQTYGLIFVDDGGDGLCCGSGQGNATVYLGAEENDDKILTTIDGEFTNSESVTFALPKNTPTEMPTRNPTDVPSAPPTRIPTTAAPTDVTSAMPTRIPTTAAPTDLPSTIPTRIPTTSPVSLEPSLMPVVAEERSISPSSSSSVSTAAFVGMATLVGLVLLK